VNNVTTPTLFLHGDDYDVHITRAGPAGGSGKTDP
jgi:hypothetical protein